MQSAQAESAVDDAALASRARTGDRDAYGALYERFAPVLLGVALRILHDDREAGDVVHDVFVEAWEHIREYDAEKGSVRTWLLLRLRSRALDRLGRAEPRRTEFLADGDVLEGRAGDLRVDAVDALAVRRALENVDAAARDVLECTYFGGLTAREIAERYGVPVGTVKSRLARGLSVLAALFQGDGDD